ncbi:MAG: anthranilate phosphoribosyltransferase [Ruminiclostridium sp.]|nr:anthranilate phosphoribosyltransferase [Ruminiclostridium sp.]
MLKVFIQKLLRHENLTEQEIISAMEFIMEGSASDVQIAGFLTGLGSKGETAEEITGCVKVMREKAEKIHPKTVYLIDTCGTGGDGAGTFNVSTAAAIVAAAGGAVVAKHGNRAMSSRSGSADVLEALGIDIMLTPEQVAQCIDRIGIGFLFAQSFHKSMKHAGGVRRELGCKTVFNILGPLTNPAGAKGQVLGVFNEKLTEKMAAVLQKLGSEMALVVHGMDGLDEITITAATKISELKDGKIFSYYLDAADYGIPRSEIGSLKGGDAHENADIIKAVFRGERGPKRDMVVINAAAALYVAKKADNIGEGVKLAADIIDSGKAAKKLDELAAFTRVGKTGGEATA